MFQKNFPDDVRIERLEIENYMVRRVKQIKYLGALLT